jgi:hypothetical protein
MHGTLREMMKGVPGADDVVMGLDATLRPSQDRFEASGPGDRIIESVTGDSLGAQVQAVGRTGLHALEQSRPSSEDESDHVGDLRHVSSTVRAE